MDVRGQFGDIFGGVNALFTGLAFAGVIYTILLQRRELELQREELRLNRAELSRSARAQMEQVSRLEEAADLSAMTTLLDVYGALLQPLWEDTAEIRSHIGSYKSQLEAPHLPDHNREQLNSALETLYERLKDREAGWTDTLRKRQELIEKLEVLVEQRTQEGRELQETE
jgi:hypothetical protein